MILFWVDYDSFFQTDFRLEHTLTFLVVVGVLIILLSSQKKTITSLWLGVGLLLLRTKTFISFIRTVRHTSLLKR